MKHYVMIFRATRPLTPEEQKQRPSDIRQWIQRVNAMGIQLDPRNMGEFAEQILPGETSPVVQEGPADAGITTMVFFDAAGNELASDVAKMHPGPHYGVKVELREWAPPQVPLSR